MKILIPTAKDMRTDLPQEAFEPLGEKTEKIIEALSKMSLAELASLYKIGEGQAKREKERIESIREGRAAGYPAIRLFDGLMYRSIPREELSEEEAEYLRENVLICSALYGMLSPYTPISEHRLDFQQNIRVEEKSLKQYWRADFEERLEGEGAVLSLLSEEFESVFSREKRKHWISPIFRESGDFGVRTHSTLSKKGRGKLLGYLMRNRIRKIEDIREIEFEGFHYRGEEKGRPVFMK